MSLTGRGASPEKFIFFYAVAFGDRLEIVMKKRSFLVLLLLCISLVLSLTACGGGEGTLESLQNEYGFTVEGGGFKEGTLLVSRVIEAASEEGRSALAAIADKAYNKEGALCIFDIKVTKDGTEVQPSGKVKVSAPFDGTAEGYLLFHVKADGSAETLMPTVKDGRISFETDSFSYFIVAEPEPEAPPHTHTYTRVDGKAATCTEEGILAHYLCEGCGGIFNDNYEVLTSAVIAKSAHAYGAMYYANNASFWEDGNIAYYQCEGCDGYFDEQYHAVATVTIPKLSTNISICVNGTPTALTLDAKDESHVLWSLSGLSVEKGDVITLCATDDASIRYEYFADGNVGTDGKILTTAADAEVTLYATPNGLMLSISGYRYEGVVIEINGVQYPMHFVTYSNEETTAYIYGYVNFAVGDRFVIVDNVSGTVYGYDDLIADYKYNTWDFHRGTDGEIVIDYAARYGVEFDTDGNGQLYLTKVFAPLDGASYELVTEGAEDGTPMMGMRIPAGTEEYEAVLWYFKHETVTNVSDILSYVDAKGLYVYSLNAALTAGTRFRLENLTASVFIGGEHLADSCGTEGAITVDGDYIEVLEDGEYFVIYLPAYNVFAVERLSSEPAASISMLLDGDFIPLIPDADGNVFYTLTAEENTSISFLGAGSSPLPLVLDAEMDSSLVRLYTESGVTVAYIIRAGEYSLVYNVNSGNFYIEAAGGTPPPDPSVTYMYFVGIIDMASSGNNNTLMMSRDDTNGDLYVKTGIEITAGQMVMVVVVGTDNSDASYYALAEGTDPAIASVFMDMAILINVTGTYDVSFDTVSKTVGIVPAT